MATEEPSKARKTAAGITGALLAGVMVVGSFVGASVDGKHLAKPVTDALAAKGLSAVNAKMTGREAHLTGPASDMDAAKAAAQDVYGVRWADFKEAAGGSTPQVEAQLPTIDISNTGSGTTLSGTVPSEDLKAQLGEQAARIFGEPVTNNLTVDPAVQNPNWLTGLTGALPKLPQIQGGSLSLTGPGGLALSGIAPDLPSIDTIKTDLAAALPGIATSINLTAPSATPTPSEEPTQTPRPTAQAISPDVSIDATGSGVTVTGTVPTQADKDKLLAAAEKSFGKPVTDKVTIDPASAGSPWLDSLLGALPQLPAIKGGKLTANADGVNLSGQVDKTGTIDSVKSLLTGAVASLPASVNLTAPAPKPAPKPAATTVPADVVKSINGTTVWYPTASFALQPADKKKLNAAIANMKKYQSIKVEVDGYVSLPHNAATRTSFSKDRAQSVKDYLVAGGIDASRITVVGKGASNPIASNNTAAGRLKNQRATLTVKES